MTQRDFEAEIDRQGLAAIDEAIKTERARIRQRLADRWPGASAEAIDALIGPDEEDEIT